MLAKWNKRTNEVEVLDGIHTEQEVRKAIDTFSSKLKERMSLAKTAHRKSINLINEYLNTKNILYELGLKG